MSHLLQQSQATPRWAGVDRPTLALGALLLATTLMRFFVGAQQPLWLDETWTGMIAGQKTLGGFLQQLYIDPNAPLYYGIAWLWAQVAGFSDAALRAPAAVFGALAPLVVLSGASGLDRRLRMLWCGLLACWIPGLWFSQDARCYTLLLLLGCANAVAFAALLSAPTLGRAFAWTGLSTLLVLTHYYAGPMIALQGLAYLAVHRLRAVRTWPAALAFAPALAWIALHLPRLAAYARPEVAWYPVLGFADLAPSVGYLLGGAPLLLGIAAWAAAAILLGRQAEASAPADPSDRAVFVVASVSIVTALALIGVGFLRPSFSDRYLTPLAPGALLGLAWLALRLGRRWPLAPAAAVALFVAAALGWAIQTAQAGERLYNFETASGVIADSRASRLVFLWDHPNARIGAPSQLGGVGGFFLRREGHPVVVDPVQLKAGEDPNIVLAERARPPGSAILWLYDTAVQGSAASRFPPRISERDPAWRCRNFGAANIGVVTCLRRAA